MFSKKGSRNPQRSPLPEQRPATHRTLPPVAPAIVPGYRGASRTAPATELAVAPPTTYKRDRGVYRAAPAVAPRGAPPLGCRGWALGAPMQGSKGPAPRAAPKATPGPARPAYGHREVQWYKASTPELDTVAPDPLDPVQRYHTGIFVETKPDISRGAL